MAVLEAREGVSYPVHLRATPMRTGEGQPGDFADVMWSADLALTPDGSGLTASGPSPEEALVHLQDVIVLHSVSDIVTDPAPSEGAE